MPFGIFQTQFEPLKYRSEYSKPDLSRSNAVRNIPKAATVVFEGIGSRQGRDDMDFEGQRRVSWQHGAYTAMLASLKLAGLGVGSHAGIFLGMGLGVWWGDGWREWFGVPDSYRDAGCKLSRTTGVGVNLKELGAHSPHDRWRIVLYSFLFIIYILFSFHPDIQFPVCSNRTLNI